MAEVGNEQFEGAKLLDSSACPKVGGIANAK